MSKTSGLGRALARAEGYKNGKLKVEFFRMRFEPMYVDTEYSI